MAVRGFPNDRWPVSANCARSGFSLHTIARQIYQEETDGSGKEVRGSSRVETNWNKSHEAIKLYGKAIKRSLTNRTATD